ncbi:DNA-directed RNA polymerase V subunit 1 [Cucumis melo]|uniref:DNA-directed RNA polymerase subunit n=1 Tax=Cucumis melo TaxID=3656 RepID=A0A1S3CPU1_CUCME|nr:DNA-directed RNA polymerase V subunit 1 [Cucumis melo]XP_050946281.1 DNA-directed RNA polymerase V subunit 1 [Cucumis melo]
MEEAPSCSSILDAEIVGIRFSLANGQEICIAAISDCPITHASQLSNPFLGLPIEFGKCESCGTSEPGKCEGHFGYIELPIPIYHPNHITELRKMLSLLCLKCLKMKKTKFPSKNIGFAERLLSSCCEDASQVTIREAKKADGASYLQLKVPSRTSLQERFWDFLERYGFRYGDNFTRTLLPCEVKEMLKKIPNETRKKLAGRGYYPQDGYILQYLPVPPNCLSVPEISDGVTVMSSDPAVSMLKKILKQVEIIKGSRSGAPNFESHEVEANDLQLAVDQYLQVRGTVKASRGIDARFGVNKELNDPSTKAWLEKMRTLFIRKGSGFSSRSVITGDAYKLVNEIGVPFEVAQRITFEERVSVHNIRYLQELVDKKLCLTYRDGSSAYSLREGSMGHTYLKPGQIVHRRIMDGDIVFINRPPTTHKHSLQALRVYLHDDHVVKINPLICGSLSADFDGDCIHLFYPQSIAAKAEVLGLFSVEKQLLSSHSGNLNLQLANDSLLSLKMMFRKYFLGKAAAQQLAMFVSSYLPPPALLGVRSGSLHWTALQILQTVLPACFDCHGDSYLIKNSNFLKFDFDKDAMPSLINEILTSIFFQKGPEEVLKFFDSLQPLLMEHIFSEGFSVGLDDYSMPMAFLQALQKNIQVLSPLLYQLRSTFNELVELQLENHLRSVKVPFTNFILKLSSLGKLFDSKSESAINKVVQQIGFLGLQLSDKGRFYSKSLIEDVASLFHNRYSSDKIDYPSAEFGLVKGCFFHGLDPYEEMVHSISTREVMVRSSRGLTEPGTLFKNLMAILRDVVICYDGTVRNVCSNSIIQLEYGMKAGMMQPYSLFPPGEPVGVLAATAMSTPAYKAVLDSTPSSNSSWDMMKEILLCKVSFKNEPIDRRVILYLNNCACGRKYCNENAAYVVKSHLKKVTLKDVAVDFMIEYNRQPTPSGLGPGLVGHVHLNRMLLKELNINMTEVLRRCQETMSSFKKKKKKVAHALRFAISEHCAFHQWNGVESIDMPCLIFWHETRDVHLERTAHILADIVFPLLSETIIKGDPRIKSASVIWISPDSTSWQKNPSRWQDGELALDVCLEKSALKQNGDAWRNVLDCCLPVLHLIDTRRSVPYAIKQVQELLGISCAFDQMIQRLSKSVSMVSKGVLGDHLILLANSMTCTGNMIGFNSGGYKALSRALNIQVPFTEATLFTPRKCFEKAAEKCHKDSLSSIVASCSWGKHVAVGTGSRFDILWDQKELGCKQDDVVDVYNFLHMVRSGKSEEPTSACLGEEVEDIMVEDEYGELTLSPEPFSTSEKPVFEDSAEFEHCLDNDPGESKWEKAPSLGAVSTGGGQWESNGNGKATKSSDDNDWSGWGRKAEPDVTVTNAQENTSNSAWDTTSSWGNKATITSNDNDWSNCSTKEVERDSFTSMEKTPKSGGWDTASTWGTKTKDDSFNGETAPEKSNQWSSLQKDKAETQDAFHKKAEMASKSSGWEDKAWSRGTSKTEDNWSGQVKDKAESFQVPVQKVSSKTNGWGSTGGWTKNSGGDHQAEAGWNDGQASMDREEASDRWDRKATQKLESHQTSSWGSPTVCDSKDSFPSKAVDHGDSVVNHSWDRQKSPEASQGFGNDAWQQQKSQDVIKPSHANNESNRSGWGSQIESNEGSDHGFDQVTSEQKSSDTRGWDSQEKMDKPWDKQKSLEASQSWGSQNDSLGSWGQPQRASEEFSRGSQDDSSTQFSQLKPPETSLGWEQQKSPEVSHGWGSHKESSEQTSSHGWDKKNQGSKGWGGNAGEWKNRKNRPPKSPGMSSDDANLRALYTASGQRLDMFTTEEQDILADIEPIMQSIRKVMHQSGYNDGDPLSAEDQSFVLQSVFNFHPDKAAKMGAGIDHFMVSRHSSFQESRCFYVVTTDGHKEDFSYRKCLDNFIKGKYPDMAEMFVAKYFRKPRPNRNRDRNPASEENENKSVGGELTPIPEEAQNGSQQE